MARGPTFNYRPGQMRDRILASDTFATLQRELNRVFEELDLPTRPGSAGLNASPVSLDVLESESAVIVHADLPGVRPEDVDVSLDEDTLTIRGQRAAVVAADRDTVHLTERSGGTFHRSVRLPAPVDPDGVQARFEHGVLTVTLAKTHTADRSRKIPVQAAATGASSVDQPHTAVSAAVPAPAEAQENATRPGGAVHGYNE